MANFATALKEEIRRLARKEIRAATTTTKSSTAQHRRDIAELKRQVRTLTKEVNSLRRREQNRAGRPEASERGTTVRFSPSWVRKHRDRLEVSAADYGALVGVSGLTIYNWEKGKTKPREKQLAAWAAVRSLGKREAWKRLEAMDAQ
ncbi:MAG: hypothetical protein GY715_19385 [Planctomycetes bacterium]|nr:hypothetical protein [Planctomycetota bacterium]